MTAKPLKVESRPISDLIPYARNARLHSDAQVADIAASIKEFGFNNPVLIDHDGGIIAGHGRVLAARKLGMDKVPCIALAHLSDTQKRAYIIADNRLALSATWDEEMLAVELEALAETDLDLDLLGFESFELDRLLHSDEPALDTASEWQGMPEFRHEDKTAFRSLYVHLKDQEAVDEFARLVGQKITDATKYIWFPEIEIESAADKRYGAE